MTEHNPPKNNWVAKHAEEFNRPATHKDKKKFRKPKYTKPVHEIDIHDRYIDENEIYHD